MSVEHIKGDLLDFPNGINVIAHCANCMNTMGSGIAKAIKERYPAAFEADTKMSEKKEVEMGRFSLTDVAEGKKVVNLYGQYRFNKKSEDWKRHLDYEAIFVALETLRDVMEDARKKNRFYTLGLPYRMGCDRAGGSWVVMEAMINSLFASSPIKCFIVTLPEEPVVEAPKQSQESTEQKPA